MSIIGYLRSLSPNELKQVRADPSAAYRLIFPDFESHSVYTKTMRQEELAWKMRNAPILLKAFTAGSEKNLVAEDQQRFERAVNELQATVMKNLTPFMKISAPPMRGGKTLCLQKAWHGIHFLLTGVSEGGEPPLAFVVLGDKEIPDTSHMMGYGPARYLTSKQVKLVSNALHRIKKSKFLSGFEPERFRTANIYALHERGDELELLAFFEKLKAFYALAAKRNNGMLAYFR